ncbi:MAG TPA: glycosyltransferase family 1 protein [Myxococcota bacterium]|nr:glycosyltransferase family 1 protein [Myxococcota bacterium]
MSALRILHCPALIGGNPSSLARHERALGLESHCVAFRPSPFAFPADEILETPGTSYLRFELRRWRLLWRALRDYDIVHFNFGRTILPSLASLDTLARSQVPAIVRSGYELYARSLELRDLWLLRRFGKGIVVTYQGDDARQGDVAAQFGEVSPVGEVEPGYYDPKGDARKRAAIACFDRYADRIYALNPDLLHVLPPRARFLPYAHVDPREWIPPAPRPVGGVPVVVHAPTHRGVKGSRFLFAAAERLRSEGVAFELRLVEGLSHREARRAYEGADLFVDQLLVGWYGGVAVELMALERPVLCFLREEDLRFVPTQMREEIPIVRVAPATIYEVLKEWITASPEHRAEQGRRGRRYVERWHDPARIAADLAQAYAEIAEARFGRRPLRAAGSQAVA